MTEEDWWTIEAMEHYGGGFVKALGAAARHADPDNLARIKATWPESWAKYAAIGARLGAEAARDEAAMP